MGSVVRLLAPVTVGSVVQLLAPVTRLSLSVGPRRPGAGGKAGVRLYAHAAHGNTRSHERGW